MYKISKAVSKTDYAYCVYIRTLVFIVEQPCDLDDEIDCHENDAVDYLICDDDGPCATARYRNLNNGICVLERIAVLKQKRYQGIGARLIKYVIDEIRTFPDVVQIQIGARNHLVDYYKKFGFIVKNDDDNGSILNKMILDLNKKD